MKYASLGSWVPGLLAVLALGGCSSTTDAALAPFPPAGDGGGTTAQGDSGGATADGGTTAGRDGGTTGGRDGGTTATDGSTIPPNTPCVSGTHWTRGTYNGSSSMDPGQACIACHTTTTTQGGEAPLYVVAGTAFYGPHEEDNCNGYSGTPPGSGVGAAFVEVTDGAGMVYRLAINRAGNFFTEGNLVTPLQHVRVIGPSGAVNDMVEAPPDGDCNGCHTQDGTSTASGFGVAPGRITVPN